MSYSVLSEIMDNKAAYSQIYDDNIEKIYRFIFLKVNSQEIAEDLTSEVFTRGWDTFRGIKNMESEIKNPRAFLYQIARNIVTDYYRRKGRAQTASIDSLNVVDPAPGPDEAGNKALGMEIIKSALNRLNEDYKEMVIWHYIEDLSVPEIAKILDKSEGSVRVSLHRALEALKSVIKTA